MEAVKDLIPSSYYYSSMSVPHSNSILLLPDWGFFNRFGPLDLALPIYGLDKNFARRFFSSAAFFFNLATSLHLLALNMIMLSYKDVFLLPNVGYFDRRQKSMTID